MAITKTQNGAQSVTYFLDEGESTDGRLDQNQWPSLLPGKLKDLLNRTYVTLTGERDIPAFSRACADAGLTISATSVFGGGETPLLRLGESVIADGSPAGTPYIVVSIPSNGVIVHIETSYSASE